MEITTTVYLVRHGQTTANVTNTIQGQSDVPLDDTGVRQAELVGARLRSWEFDMIFSSDLSRAAVTASAIAGDRPIVYNRDLREWDLGDWVGMTLQESAEKYPEEMARYRSGAMDAEVPGGESRQQFHDRAEKVMNDIITNCAGKTVLCVTHGGLLRAIFKNIIGSTAYYPRLIRTDNTCLCGFKYFHDSCQWQLLLWNDTSHLAARALSSGW